MMGKRKRRVVKEPSKKLELPPMVEENFRQLHAGRPTKMTSAARSLIRHICMVQANPSNATLIESLGIGESTFYRWLDTYAGLREEINKQRQLGLEMLRRRAYLLANGGDRTMLKFILGRRDPDYKSKSLELEVDALVEGTTELPDSTFL